MSDYEKIYTEDSVWKSILQMAVPALITILVMIFYNMADMFFIGQTGNTAMVASVSIVSPVFSLIMGIATMTGIGGSTIIANVLGGGDRKKASVISSLCFWFSLVIGILLAIVLLIAREPLLSFLGAVGDMHDGAETYLSILALGTPFLLLSGALGNLVRAEGAVKEGLIGNLAGTVTNIVLDPLFILIFHWGIGGAAVATVIGNAAGTFFYVGFILRKSAVLTMNPRLLKGNIREIGPVLALGLPNAVSTILNGFASTFANQLLASHGTTAVAAMAAAEKSSMLIAMVQMGVCMGAQPLLSYSYGQGNRKRMKELLKDILILTLSFGILSAVLCFMMRDGFIHMFLKDQSAYSLGVSFIPYLVISSPFLGLYYLSTNYLQAAKKAGLAVFTSVLRQGAVLIPVLYFMHAAFGLNGIVLSYPVSDISSSLIVLFIFLHQYQQFMHEDVKETVMQE